MIQLVSRIISPTSLNTSQTHSISSLMPESCFASILGQFLPNRLWEKSTYERNYWPALLRTKQQQNFVLKDWTWAKVPNMLAKCLRIMAKRPPASGINHKYTLTFTVIEWIPVENSSGFHWQTNRGPFTWVATLLRIEPSISTVADAMGAGEKARNLWM